MGKSIAKVGAVIAGAALIATGIGAAAGIGLLGASASALAASGGAWTLFGVSVSTLGQIGAGLTALGSLTTKRPDVGTGGSPVQQTYDPQAGIPYAMGRTAVAGRIHYGTTAPANNKYRLFYSVLSGGGPIWGIEAFYANNEFVGFGADGGEGATGKYLNRLWQVRRLGASSDTYLHFTGTGSKDTPADHGGNPPEWTSAHKTSGYAVALTACEYDTKIYAGDIQPLWVIYGTLVYDPRLDSTYPGGFGDCRAGVESTYVYSDNPWLHALTFALGRFQNGKRVMGLGAPISSIIVSQFVEAANVADANGWKVGGTVYSTDDKWADMQAMAQAGGGYCVPMGAQIGCVVNAPRVSIGEITSADIVGEASAAGTKGRRDRINRVIPRYRSEDHNWEVVSAAPIEVAEHIAFDGGQRTREVDYTLVQDVVQAAQLSRYDIENSRELEPLVFRLGPAFLGYRAGDCLTANVADLGLVDQDVIVVRRTFDPSSGTVSLECRSETSAKHAYCLGQTTTPPPTPSLNPGDFEPGLPNPDDWNAEGGVLASADGSIPVIVIRGILDEVHAVAVIVDYRAIFDTSPVTYSEWVSQEFPAASLAPSGEDPRVTINLTGLAPGQRYQVRVRYRTVRNVENPDQGTDLGDVTTGLIVSAGVKEIAGLTPVALVDELRANTQAGRELAKSNLALAMGAIDERGQLISETFHNGVRVKRILIDEDQEWEEGDKTFWSRMGLMALLSPSGNSMIMRHDTLMWSATESLADHVEAIRTQIGTDIAAFNTQIRTWVNTSSAGVLWINALEVNFGNNFRGAITQTASIVSGMGASYTISTDVNGLVAGLRLVNTGATSGFVVSAAEIGFSNGSTTLYPLAIVGGVVKATNFEADRVRANSITAASIVVDSIKYYHIEDGNVNTGHIVTRDVTDRSVSAAGFTIPLSVGVWTTLRTVNRTTGEGACEIRSQATIGSASSDSYVSFRVLVDSAAPDSWPKYVKGGAYDRSVSDLDYTPGSGSHTFTLQAMLEPGSGPADAVNYRLAVVEHKTER
jgi:hypothetical protein